MRWTYFKSTPYSQTRLLMLLSIFLQVGCSAKVEAEQQEPIPEEIKRDSGAYVLKEQLISNAAVGEVTDFFQPPVDTEFIYLAGTKAYAIYDSNYQQVSQKRIDLQKDAKQQSSLFVRNKAGEFTGILRVSGATPNYDKYLDVDGKEIWRSTEKSSLYTACAFFDSDQSPNIIEVFRNSITAFKTTGEIAWKDSVHGNSAAAIIGKNGGKLFTATNAKLREFDPSGVVLRNTDLEGLDYVADMATVEGEFDDTPTKILIPSDKGYKSFDESGHWDGILYKAPYLVGINALLLQHNSRHGQVLVIAGNYLDQGGERFGLAGVNTHIYFFGPEGELLFEDMFINAWGGALIQLRHNGPILLGVGEGVYGYKLLSEKPKDVSIQ